MKTTDPIGEQHQPIWNLTRDETGERCYYVAGCTGCDWNTADQEDSVASFGVHLKEAGGPDYLITYWDDWADHIEARTAGMSPLTRDAVARELFDYGVVMGEASKVYEELAGFSKPNTAAVHVIDGAEEKFAAQYADFILCDLLPRMDSDDTRQAVIDYANQIHEGAYEEHQQFAARQKVVAA